MVHISSHEGEHVEMHPIRRHAESAERVNSKAGSTMACAVKKWNDA